MSNFPLYSKLLREIKSKDSITQDEKTFFIDNVKKLSTQEYEIIYALIRTYQISNEESYSYVLPYQGKQLKKSVRFDLDLLPSKLSVILYQFLNVHLSSL